MTSPKDMIPLGREQYVSVGEWDGQKRVNIRQYKRYAEGSMLYATKKGLFLTPDNWIDLMHEKDVISAALEKVQEN